MRWCWVLPLGLVLAASSVRCKPEEGQQDGTVVRETHLSDADARGGAPPPNGDKPATPVEVAFAGGDPHAMHPPTFSDGPASTYSLRDEMEIYLSEDEAEALLGGWPEMSTIDVPDAPLPDDLTYYTACQSDFTGDGLVDTVALAGDLPETDWPTMQNLHLVVIPGFAAAMTDIAGPIGRDVDESCEMALLCAADVDGDGRREVVLQGVLIGASAMPTFYTVFGIDKAGHCKETDFIYSESPGVTLDLDDDGVVEFLVYMPIGWDLPHVLQPRWTGIYQLRGNAFINVEDRFPEHAGVPIDELLALGEVDEFDVEPLEDCQICFHIGRRYQMDGDVESAYTWYLKAQERYDAEIAQWQDEMGGDVPGLFYEEMAELQERLEAIEEGR